MHLEGSDLNHTQCPHTLGMAFSAHAQGPELQEAHVEMQVQEEGRRRESVCRCVEPVSVCVCVCTCSHW